MQKEVLVLSALMLVGGLVSCGGNQQQDKKRMKQEMTTESNDTIMKQFTKENLYWVREPKRYLITDVKTSFNSSALFDQCGIAIYLDSDNWMKASIEYENEEYQRLGSVVTNNGYSDWATHDIPSSIREMWYRLSRRESDYYIETSLDGVHFKQMRSFHLFHGDGEISFGIYAASPVNHSFTAKFTDMKMEDCKWEAWSSEKTGFSQTTK